MRPGDLDELEAVWHAETEAVLTGLKEWRLRHPTATLAEMEAAVDERLAPVRARMLERLALASQAADLAGRPAGVRARCPDCGQELRPRLHEGLVRLGAWMPFARAAGELGWFCGVDVSAATACRLTAAAGAALVARETAEAERLARETPAPPDGPRVLAFSADGAMVPLVKGEWTEAKTLALGEVVATRGPDGEPVVRTRDVSSFSRLADAETFGHLALVETHRRGTATAGTVVAPMDGSDWLQGVLALHRPDAVRILDFPHAAEHLSAAAQATWGVGTPAAAAWLAAQAHELKTGDPDRVLGALRALPTHDAADPALAERTRDETLAYLEKRRAQIAYACFQACGFPIGSGMVESGNKNVVEARLKGAGMHWARPSVNPMLALRCAVRNDRWDETWPRIARARCRGAPACPTRARRRPGLSAAASRPRRAPRPPRARESPRCPPIAPGRPSTAAPPTPTPGRSPPAAAPNAKPCACPRPRKSEESHPLPARRPEAAPSGGFRVA